MHKRAQSGSEVALVPGSAVALGAGLNTGEMDGGESCTTTSMNFMPLNCTVKYG